VIVRTVAANALSRQAEDALQQRHAASDIAALDHEPASGSGGMMATSSGTSIRIGGSDGVEADGRAGSGVPDQHGGRSATP
jgi:hypothetical protein